MQRERAYPKDTLFSSIKILLHAVTLFEAIDTSTAVNQLLTASEKRMAFAADFDLQLTAGRAGRKRFTASAANRCFAIRRMDVLLHDVHSFKNTTNSYYMRFVRKKQALFQPESLFAALFTKSVGGRIAILLINPDPVFHTLEELLICGGLIQHTDELLRDFRWITARKHPPNGPDTFKIRL